MLYSKDLTMNWICLLFVLASAEAGLWDRILGRCSDEDVLKPPSQDIEPGCLAAADSGSCGFYDCFERRYPCGGCGFSSDYGTYNCEKFYLPSYYDRLNDAGKRWVNATGLCLLQVMKGLYIRDTASCRMIRTTMIDHVSTCYLDNGVISFCNIFWDNKDVLYGVYEARDLAKSETILNEVLQIAGTCTGERMSESGGRIRQHLSNFLGRIESAASSVGGWLRDRLREIQGK